MKGADTPSLHLVMRLEKAVYLFFLFVCLFVCACFMLRRFLNEFFSLAFFFSLNHKEHQPKQFLPQKLNNYFLKVGLVGWLIIHVINF